MVQAFPQPGETPKVPALTGRTTDPIAAKNAEIVIDARGGIGAVLDGEAMIAQAKVDAYLGRRAEQVQASRAQSEAEEKAALADFYKNMGMDSPDAMAA